MSGNLPDGCTQRDIDEAFQSYDDSPADVLRHARHWLIKTGYSDNEFQWVGFNEALEILREAEYEDER